MHCARLKWKQNDLNTRIFCRNEIVKMNTTFKLQKGLGYPVEQNYNELLLVLKEETNFSVQLRNCI